MKGHVYISCKVSTIKLPIIIAFLPELFKKQIKKYIVKIYKIDKTN